MRLILWSFHSNGASARDNDRPRFCSSGSKSQTVVPSSTRPIRLMAPALWRRASASVVFPDPPWPTRATLRIFSGEKRFTNRLPPVHSVELLWVATLLLYGISLVGKGRW